MSSRLIRQFLSSLYSAGVRHVPTVKLPEPTSPRAVARRAASRKSTGQDSRPVTARSDDSPAKSSPPRQAAVQFRAPVKAQERSSDVLEILNSSPSDSHDKQGCLQKLSEVVSRCDRCTELSMQRRQTVFGTGNPDARIMFIGEAPGSDEDLHGEPFVGAAGQLLNKIIAACGLTREEIYICNILRCRPPGNRNPLPQEAANCREYLDAQIKVVDPDYIVCWGTIAAQNLLSEQRTVGKLRGKFHTHKNAKVLCTYHPSYLLRYPQQKKEVWGDMKILMADMGVDL